MHILDKKQNDDYIFNFSCPSSYDWDIITKKDSATFDKEIFSLTLYKKQLDLIYQLEKVAGDKIFDISCTTLSYLQNMTLYHIGNITPTRIKKLWEINSDKKIDSQGKMYNTTLKILNKQESILSYSFESSMSINIYHLINKYLYLHMHNYKKYVIFAKNQYMLDGLLYYCKFKLLQIQPDITFFAYEIENDLFEKAQNFLKVNNINKISIKTPLNNTWINNTHISKIDMALIDITINNPHLTNIRYAYLFQSQFAPFIFTLKNLNENGTIILNICLIPNKMIFNMITYISCYFKKTFISDFKETELYSPSQLQSSLIIFDSYTGNIDINKLLNLNEIMFQCDPSGGYLFNTQNESLKNSFNINYDNNETSQKFVTNIITINDENINNKYLEYKEYCKMKLLGSIRNFNTRYDNFINESNDKNYMNNKCALAKTQAIYYAKKYDLPLLDWVNEIPTTYFNTVIAEKLKNVNYTTQNEMKYNFNNSRSLIDVYKTIKCDNCDILIKNIAISESAYMYIEKINYDKYKNVELFINNKYKKLNSKLYDVYNININNKSVSRAWIKMQELLTDINILKKYDNNKLDVFFMCEAPGNFINSMDYFIKNKTQINKFDWHAQSLSQIKADFFDSYGFIKKTIDQWDMGPKKTGDILDHVNQTHYFKKYGNNVDLLIGDCGEKWTPADKNNNKDLSVYQLFYALMIPKVGGSFIIKTFSSNNNLLYLSLLYTICTKYEKVIIFKSNTNFWSPEIYVIGLNNKGTTITEKEHLLTIIEKVNNGDIAYPIQEIPKEFIQDYDSIMYGHISYASDIKKFFVFLATNDDIYNKNKDNITNIIFEKNNGWIEKYIGDKSLKF